MSNKKIKMGLYGDPGTGKSVFSSKAPNAFFICTDGNYAWLEDFGADPNAHIDVSSWDEMKKVINNKELLQKYDTIVIDLLEDAFKWCEAEYCVKNRLDHVSDAGYGKGYDTTRNEFFVQISKLLSMDKNIILIMHGTQIVVKDRRGVEHTKFVPSPRLPDKLIDMIEGRLRYFLRCYVKAEETKEGTLVKKRYLSLVPKENEFGIIRGVDENTIPHDIPLDWDEFTKVIGFDNTSTKTETVKVVENKSNLIVNKEIPQTTEEKVIEVKEENKEEDIKESQPENSIGDLPFDNTPVTETQVTEPEKVMEPEESETEVKEEVKEEIKPISNADKLAAIKAKIAAMNAANKKGDN